MQNIKTIFLDWNGTICNNVFGEQLNNSTTKDIFEKIIKKINDCKKTIEELERFA